MTTINHVTALRLIANDHIEGYTVLRRDSDNNNLHSMQVRDEDGIEYRLSFDADNLPEQVELIPNPVTEEV